MNGISEASLAIVYSTPQAGSMADFVAAHYELPGPIEGSLLRRGFNDTFEVRAGDGGRFVLRLSGRRKRGEADVVSETAFLAHLERQGVPVAAPMPARDGSLFAAALLPEGRRPAVLFRFVEGRPPRASAADARAQGVTLARIHDSADDFVAPGPGRYRLDLDHLLHRPMASLLEIGSLSDATRSGLVELAERLAKAVSSFGKLSWTRCHGDCHGGNARITIEGQNTGQATFFDFDDGGPGYLAYDPAVYLWARVSFRRQEQAMWHAFIEGYRSIRALLPEDFEAAHVFVPIRHIWLMGEYAARLHEWGTEAVADDWVTTQLAFMQTWESEKLVRRLL